MTKISVIEKLKGQSGWLILTLLTVDAFAKQEFLLFTAQTDSGHLVDNEVCKKLFSLNATVANDPKHSLSDALPPALLTLKNRHIDIKLADVMDQNNMLFAVERDKLEKWADDKILAAEETLQDTKAKIKSIKREARHALTIEEQKLSQEKLQKLEREQRRQRMAIFEVEDEIAEKRDELIAVLENRMKQKIDTTDLFTLRWQIT